jgi:hypothetical protein
LIVTCAPVTRMRFLPTKHAFREEHRTPYRMVEIGAEIGTLGRPIPAIGDQPLGGRGEEP